MVIYTSPGHLLSNIKSGRGGEGKEGERGGGREGKEGGREGGKEGRRRRERGEGKEGGREGGRGRGGKRKEGEGQEREGRQESVLNNSSTPQLYLSIQQPEQADDRRIRLLLH